MIEQFNMGWKAACGQLNLAHATVSVKIYRKEETKTNKRQCQLSPVLGIHVQKLTAETVRALSWNTLQTPAMITNAIIENSIAAAKKNCSYTREHDKKMQYDTIR